MYIPWPSDGQRGSRNTEIETENTTHYHTDISIQDIFTVVDEERKPEERKGNDGVNVKAYSR